MLLGRLVLCMCIRASKATSPPASPPSDHLMVPHCPGKVNAKGGSRWCDPSMQLALQVAAPKQGLVIDVGAAFAIQTLMAYHAGRRVVGIECRVDEFKSILGMVKHIPNITMLHTCVGAQAGMARLYHASDSSSMVEANVNNDAREQRKANASRVNDPRGYEDAVVIPLDALLSDLEEPVALIKVDVQGAEYGVFKGARNIMARDKPILMYEDVGRFEREGDIQAGILHKLGYSCSLMSGEDYLCSTDGTHKV